MSHRTKLQLIRSVHTLIWAFFVGVIFHILYAGITNTITASLLVSIGLIIIETVTLLLFGWRCPLTVLAYRYTDDRSSAFDIYLPEWLARHNKSLFGGLFLIGLLLVAYRVLA